MLNCIMEPQLSLYDLVWLGFFISSVQNGHLLIASVIAIAGALIELKLTKETV